MGTDLRTLTLTNERVKFFLIKGYGLSTNWVRIKSITIFLWDRHLLIALLFYLHS